MKAITCPRCKGSGTKRVLEDGIFCAFAKLLYGSDECPLCSGKGIIFVKREDDYE